MRFIPYLLLLVIILNPFDSIYAKQPPEFWIKNMEGDRFRSSKQKTPFVISFFFVNCIPCIKEIPLLYKFMSKNHPNTPLLFMDPINQDSKKDIKTFAKKLSVPLSYFYKDTFGSISKKFFKGKMAFPTIFGIKGGEYIFRFKGIDEKTISKMRILLWTPVKL
jgi:thiol-disulfide isomerase/thioredoxin